MREFALEQAAWDAYRKIELFDNFVDLSVENALTVVEKAFKIRKADRRPAQLASACRWHTHLTTSKCEEHDGADGETTSETRRRVD